MVTTSALEMAKRLPLWHGPVEPTPLGGGITNVNFVVEDAGRRYVVRIGDDIPVHQVMRFNELAASRAAAECGISPTVVHHGQGTLVMEFVDGTPMTADLVQDAERLPRIVALVRRAHVDIARAVRGPVLMFWVFHVLRDYADTLKASESRHLPDLPELMEHAQALEDAVGPIDVVFGHNDLLAANFIDAGDRLWLIDWDYAGWNSPLFDLGGLVSNNGLDEAQTETVLEAYFERAVDDDLRRRFAAMTCASLLRETLWSMVSEIHSALDFDYGAYTAENRARFDAAFAAYRARF